MKTETKTDSKEFVANHLAQPINQLTEVLYELLKYYKRGVSRRDFMISCWILNAPHHIMTLRRLYNLTIINDDMKTKNKFGRGTSFTYYKLQDFKKAVELYNKLNPKNDV